MASEAACSVKTHARFRPLRSVEREDIGKEAAPRLDLDPGNAMVVGSTRLTGSRAFNMDSVFLPTASQESVYEKACKEMIEDLVKGYNATIFAYGQTGAGKSYTMFGADDEDVCKLSENSGVIPRAANDLFEMIDRAIAQGKKCKVSISLLEIYQETVCDLFNQTGQGLRVRESPSEGVYVENLSWRAVDDKEQIMEQIGEGMRHRHIAHTMMNAKSSRSHSLFMVNLEQEEAGEVVGSKLCLADLAGSEKIKKSGVEGLGFEEAASINQSLSTLGHCIMALSKGKGGHVPYRDSKLSFILKDSLGGNSKTALIVACSPHHSCFEETISTLQFAQRAKSIQNVVSINRVQSNAELTDVIEKLRAELKSLRTNYHLLEQQLAISGAQAPLMLPTHLLDAGDPLASPISRRNTPMGRDSKDSRDNGAQERIEQMQAQLQRMDQEKRALAAEMMAAAQLQNEAQHKCLHYQAQLEAQQASFQAEKEELLQAHAAQKVQQAAEVQRKLEELQEEKRKLNERGAQERAVLQAELQKLRDEGAPEIAEYKLQLDKKSKRLKSALQDLAVEQRKRQENDVITEVAEEEKAELAKQNATLFSEKKELAEKLSKLLMGGSIPELEEKDQAAKDENINLQAQVAELQEQLGQQGQIISEMESRFKADLKKATIEMSQFAKKSTETKETEVRQLQTAMQELDEKVEQLEREKQDSEKAHEEAIMNNMKLTEEKEKHEEKFRDLQSSQRVDKLQFEEQMEKLRRRLNRDQTKSEKEEQEQGELRLEAETLRTEVLRLRTVVSNVLREKEGLEASLEQKEGTNEQIEALRIETQRLQESAKKAQDDAKKAHSLKDELSVTLSEMEENFWKVAEKKLAATWSSPGNAKDYIPRRYNSGSKPASPLDSPGVKESSLTSE